MDTFKPMLAAPAELEKLALPVYVSPKLDGVRAIVRGGVVVSRSLKPIPNQFVQELFGNKLCEHLDGELIVGNPVAKDVFRTTTSGVMTRFGKPDVRFFAFDFVTAVLDFETRLKNLRWMLDSMPSKIRDNFVMVPQILVENTQELLNLEEKMVKDGFEGVMIRDPKGLYKCGRSTTNEGGLLKLKRFEDSEAVVLSVTEQLHNDNPAVLNELGYKERSSTKDGLRPSGVLGALKVKDLKTKVEFDIGTGYNQADRELLWELRAKLIGRVVKYKFQPVGVKEKPRFPVFLGFREQIDL